MTTILLVEDDATLREGLTELFTRDGYQVITAGSVREAKEKLTGEIQGMVMDVGARYRRSATFRLRAVCGVPPAAWTRASAPCAAW